MEQSSLLSNTAIGPIDTEGSLKVVTGKGKVQSPEQWTTQIPAVTSVAEQLSECLDALIQGVVWRHNLAKYLSLL